MNLYEEHAREKLGMPANWHVFRLECFPKSGREPTLYIEVTGAVCEAVFQRGKRKGQVNWGRRYKATEKTAILPIAEHEKWKADWETRTGLCFSCVGEKRVAIGWSQVSGTKYKPCPRCHETGKRPQQKA